ncbi:MAG TPA: energy transducer TonB [Candidatus Polarisedimenticolia bacterium]|nr:energy transducer TonB [Candidatus Polarisedimenticolia bacterium]
MPTAPEFSSLVVSRVRSGSLVSARLRGLIVAGALYSAGVAALILAPFLMLEMMPPPRAGIVPLDPFIPIKISQPRGGGPVREGVKDGRGQARRQSNSTPKTTRAIPRAVDAALPPPETEVAATASPTDRNDGQDARPGIPGGPAEGPPDGPGGNCPGCPGLGPGGPHGPDEPFDQLTPGLIAPVLVPGTRAQPEYPDLARRAGLQGTVILLVVVEADGSIGKIEVIRSPDQRWGFDLSAINAVKRWRYQPALMNERPVAAYIQVMVEFSLAR